MAFLGLGSDPETPRKRKTGERGPGKSGADRLAAAQARMLEWLRVNRPNDYAQAAIAYANGQFGVQAGGDMLDRYLEIDSKITKLRGVKRGNGTDWGEIARDAVAGLAMLTGGQRVGPPPMEPSPPQPQYLPAPQPAAAATVQTTDDDSEEIDDVKIDPSMLIVQRLSKMTPTEAAIWISQQTNADAQVFKSILEFTPDDKLPEMLNRFRPKAPALIAYIEQNMAWARQVVAILRQMPQDSGLPPEKRAAL